METVVRIVNLAHIIFFKSNYWMLIQVKRDFMRLKCAIKLKY